jgi:hypothetical protein
MRLQKGNQIIAALLLIAVIGLTTLFILKIFSVNIIPNNNEKITPTLPKTGYVAPTLSAPEVDNSYTGPSDGVFSATYIRSTIPIPAGSQYVYYFKGKDLNRYSIADKKSKVIASVPLTPLLFDVTNDEKMVIYTSRQRGGTEEYSGAMGDTISLFNINDKSNTPLYEDPSANQLEIRSIKFTPDNSKVLFTSNAINVLSLDNKKVITFGVVPKTSFCRVFMTEEISPENIAIVRNGCYEGGQQKVFDLNAQKELGQIATGYVMGGTTMVGFIDNQTLLGFNNEIKEDADFEKPRDVKLGLYSLGGVKKEDLGVLGKDLYPSHLKAVGVNEFQFTVHNSPSEPWSLRNLKLNPFSVTNPNVSFQIVSMIEKKDKTSELWISNSDYTNPQEINNGLLNDGSIVVK